MKKSHDTRKPAWIAVAAMSPNRVIGKDNALPWHYPEDLKWFRKVTRGGVVLMGRKTMESIGAPLPKRENLVLSRSGHNKFPQAKVLTSVEEALEYTSGMDCVFVIGGEEIYRQTLPYWTGVYLTRLKSKFEGDSFFPEFEADFPTPEIILETPDFTIEKYEK